MRILQVLGAILILVSCGGDEGGGGGGQGGQQSSISTLQFQINSSDVGTFSTRSLSTRVACSLSIGGTPHNGDCMTPLSLKARVARINLSNSFGGAPARLMDFSSGPEDAPWSGPQGVLGLAEYDFAAAARSTNPYSEDNVQDSGDSYFNTVTMEIGALEMKMQIPAGNGNVTDDFWTVRYILLPQNPLDISEIDSCVTSTPHREAITSNGDLYDTPNGFQQGDVLVCQKNTQGEACVDSDFRWIDSTNGSLSATRPANPVSLSGTYMFQDNSCENGGGNLVMGGANFRTNLSPAMRMDKSRESEDCLYQYSFQTNCTSSGMTSGSCSDSVQTGFGINAQVNFDLAESLFVSNSVDLTSDTEADILRNLHLVLPKPLYVENNKNAVGTGDDTDVDASVTITIDNTIATQAITDMGDSPDQYDDNFCFIPEETGGE